MFWRQEHATAVLRSLTKCDTADRFGDVVHTALTTLGHKIPSRDVHQRVEKLGHDPQGPIISDAVLSAAREIHTEECMTRDSHAIVGDLFETMCGLAHPPGTTPTRAILAEYGRAMNISVEGGEMGEEEEDEDTPLTLKHCAALWRHLTTRPPEVAKVTNKAKSTPGSPLNKTILVQFTAPTNLEQSGYEEGDSFGGGDWDFEAIESPTSLAKANRRQTTIHVNNCAPILTSPRFVADYAIYQQASQALVNIQRGLSSLTPTPPFDMRRRICFPDKKKSSSVEKRRQVVSPVGEYIRRPTTSALSAISRRRPATVRATARLMAAKAFGNDV